MSAGISDTTARRVHPRNAHHTQLMGYLTASYADLVETFGEPDPGGDKTQAEWTLRFGREIVATIYDWHADGPPEQVTEWNIGGHSTLAVDMIAQHLPNARNAR